MTRAARLAYRSAASSSNGDRLVWDHDGLDWPNRAASRFVRAGGLTWHIQQMGRGPVMLLVHGTGASTHSWRALVPLLARHFTVLAMDLPGHGFTEMPSSDRLSMVGMADALDALLKTLDMRPVVAVGHSAGAAILVRMCLAMQIKPMMLFSLNGALLPLHGLPFHLFSPVAKLMSSLSPLPSFFARLAGNQGVVERLIDNTGSKLDADGLAQYRLLFRSPGHVKAVLGMMANWRLETLERDLPHLASPLVLVVGDNDRTIPPGDAVRVRDVIPSAVIKPFPGLGHLAHEEAPEKIAELIVRSTTAALPKQSRR